MDDNSSANIQTQSSILLPNKNQAGGFGNYCSVPGCKSTFYDKNREKNNIHLFQFSKKVQEKK